MNAPVVFVGRKPSRPIVVASGAIPYVLPNTPAVAREIALALPSARGMMLYAPAGAAQQANYPAGSFSFRMAAQAFRTQPQINAANFVQLFSQALASLVPGVSASGVSIAVGAGPEVDPDGILNSADRAGPTWWVTATGRVTAGSAWMLTGERGLNRALARAVAQASTLAATVQPSGTWSGNPLNSATSPYRPADGSQLQSMLDNPEACGSHQNTRQMWMRACTTVTPLSALPTAPPPTATTTSQVGAGTLTQPSQGGNGTVYTAPTQNIGGGSPASNSGTLTSGNCAVNIISQAWIRPTATFERVGPIAPPGSLLVLLGKAVRPDGSAFTQGTLSLYHVQVAGSPNVSIIGTDGFAALDPRDVGTQSPAGCSSQIVTVPVGSNAPVASVPRPASAPPLGTALVNPVGGAGGTNSNAFPWGTAALAAGIVLVGGALVINRDKIGKAVSSGRSRASAGYEKARDAYRARRRG